MAWYPNAIRRPIAPGPNDPPIKVIGAILHVDAGNASSLFTYFRDRSGGIESHFHVPKDGLPEQYRDTGFEADANLKANSFTDPVSGQKLGYVSIETQGFAAGEWNDNQLTQIKGLLKWLSATHHFPLQVCKTSTSPGVGYHVMFGAPGPWTPKAKVCPGPDRVRQFENILVPWFKTQTQAPANAGGTPGKVDDLANADEVIALLKLMRVDEKGRYDDVANRVQAVLNEERARYTNYTARFDAIEKAVADLGERLTGAGIE